MEPAEAGRNRSSFRWVSIVGARPQFVKLAPVCRAIEPHNNHGGSPQIEHYIVHTGQHYDRALSDLFFTQMEIPEPHVNLAVGSGSQGTQLARMLARLERVLSSQHADWVIVYGDTNSALAGALLAARLKLPFAHVEAGCRSGDTEPEEQNRIVADHLSQLLLAPSRNAIENLRREGIGLENDPHRRRTAMVGDVMYDALFQNAQLAKECAEENLHSLGLKSKEYYLLTIHRAENTANADRLCGILEAVGKLDYPVLFPVHPRTKRVLDATRVSLNGKLRPVPPLGYLEMLAMEGHARKILTDSGGVQKEAFYLGVPCVTLRDRTEWPETVTLGANRIAGITPQSIHDAVAAEQKNDWLVSRPYGDGNSSARIVCELLAATAA
jgi:UDP-N-acetylglucosamine 2-epimerase